jgi:hypothetical protein
LCERGLLVLRGQGAGGPGTACRSRSGSPRRSWGPGHGARSGVLPFSPRVRACR